MAKDCLLYQVKSRTNFTLVISSYIYIHGIYNCISVSLYYIYGENFTKDNWLDRSAMLVFFFVSLYIIIASYVLIFLVCKTHTIIYN